MLYSGLLVVDVRQADGAPCAPGPMGAEVLHGADLETADFVLLLTGWDRHWGKPAYYQEWPYLSEELARRLAGAKLKGVGLDTPSLDGYNRKEAHDICAAADMINIENLTGLDQLPATVTRFQALPLKLQDTEASPVRAVAWVED